MRDAVKTAGALSDISRMRMVAALMHCEELCVCQLTALLGFAASTVSRHIGLLQDAGVVKSRKDGRWVYYRLSDGIPSYLREWFIEEVYETGRAESDREKLKEILSRDPAELCAGLRRSK